MNNFTMQQTLCIVAFQATHGFFDNWYAIYGTISNYQTLFDLDQLTRLFLRCLNNFHKEPERFRFLSRVANLVFDIAGNLNVFLEIIHKTLTIISHVVALASAREQQFRWLRHEFIYTRNGVCGVSIFHQWRLWNEYDCN